MKEKKKSAVSWILIWAGQKRIAYVWSVLLAIGNVVFKIFPYFIIADVVKLFLSGEKELEKYLVKVVLIALSFIIAELFHSLSTALSHKATFAVLANIRKSCCDKLARVPLGYVKDTPSGTFKNIMVERIDSIETTLAHIVPEFTSNLLAPIVILIYFFLTDWRLALWSLVPVIVGFLSYFGMMLEYKPSFERTVQTTKDLNDAAVEYIDGIEVIKAFGKTESSYAKFTKAAMEYADSFISWMKRCSIFHALMMVVTPYTLLTVLPFGAHYAANGTLAVSDFVICIILSLGIVGPLITVGSYTDDLGKIGVIVDEVAGILEQPELERPEKSEGVPKDNSVTLEDVRFGYHDKEILHGVTMKLKAGTVNAIVGPSGSGKSTIAKLIASLWDVDFGSIKIGGVDVKEMAFADFNRKIAYVAQDNYLFNETVCENIRQGNPDATDEQIIEVTKKSGCYEFIMQLENGFDTVVGGAGGHLSGGERQRISIARAMLKDAPIVILDEATAYTDPENEAILQSSIAKLVAGKTLLVIAHRLSTIKDSDQIFVVNDGNVTAHGTHEELLVSCPLYNEMWNAHISVKDTVKEGE
ncbi:ABC transporter ATP-binding protein/permease [Suilimivivens aceti]|uniref:ABC transporter ATP-binding protein/permease n=1 Tax=Suilimivivens aceti TaxID=2981774 RepID=A0ABT2T327_9FIRM|nr:ABC transporter ATP-binding protein [Suilimivivens aceti]MCU6744441.1 ABC transporter ATP-binding protein/permease [Suilimivivens aceti]SCH75452.1 Iron import ATP-binding/permease protein IrtA [uncultured Clostridium sp.]